MLSQEQVIQIKQRLMSQIERTLAGKDLETARQQIDSMSPEGLEEFLNRNNMVNEAGNEKCIFCSIVFGDIASYKISEDNNAVAVLEINPISKGHILVIPKNHSEDLSNEITAFAEKISEDIQKKLSPKKVLMSEQILFGHKMITLVPVYTNENLKSKRLSANKHELEDMQKILAKVEEVKEESPKQIKKPRIKKIAEKSDWLPKRIP